MIKRSSIIGLLFAAAILISVSLSFAAPRPFDLMFPRNNDTITRTQPVLTWGEAGPIDTFINENMHSAPTGTFKGAAVYDPVNKWVQLTPVDRWKTGVLEYNLPNLGSSYTTEFEFWSGKNDPFDGGAGFFYAHCDTTPFIAPSYIGYFFAVDLCYKRFQASYSGPWVGGYGLPDTTFDNSTWHKIKLVVSDMITQTQIDMYDNDSLMLHGLDQARDLSHDYAGFGATKGSVMEIRVRNMKVYGPLPVTTYEIWLDGTHVGDVTGTVYTYTPAAPLAVGKHTWYIVAVENGVRRQCTNTFTFTIAAAPLFAPRSWNDFKTVNQRAYICGGENMESALNLIQEAGIGGIRQGFDWGGQEPQEGVYNFSALMYAYNSSGGQDWLLDSINRVWPKYFFSRNIRPLGIVPYTSQLYKSLPEMSTERERNAHAAYAGALARHCKGMGVVWEFGNEPNGEAIWGDFPGSIDRYAGMVKAAARAMKTEDTSCRVVSGGTIGIPLDWLERCFQNNMLDYVDGIAVHCYGNDPPESLVDKINSLRALMRRYSPVADKIAILNSEWGMASDTPNVWRSTMLVRSWLVCDYLNMPISSWYMLRAWEYGLLTWTDNQPTGDPTHPIAPVGGTPTQVYYAAKTMLNTLKDFTVTKRIPMSSTNDWVLELRKGQKVAYAMWTIDKSIWTIDSSHTATLPITGPNSGKLVTLFGDSASKWQKFVDLQYGNTTHVTIPATGGLSVSLSECPKYLILDNDVAVQNPGSGFRPRENLRFLQNGRRVVITGFTKDDKGRTIRIYDVQGKCVNDIVVNGSGIVWKGVDRAGFAVSDGLYIVRMNGARKAGVLKIMLSGQIK